jgi:hypothetical protein
METSCKKKQYYMVNSEKLNLIIISIKNIIELEVIYINSNILSPSDSIGIQKTPDLIWNPNIHYHDHKNLPLIRILSHLNPVHTLPL